MLNWNIRPTRLHAVALLSAAAALAVSALPAGSTTMVDPEGNNIDVLYAFQRSQLTRAYWLARAAELYAGLCAAAGPVLGRRDRCGHSSLQASGN